MDLTPEDEGARERKEGERGVRGVHETKRQREKTLIMRRVCE
jgi:hypothetical protein